MDMSKLCSNFPLIHLCSWAIFFLYYECSCIHGNDYMAPLSLYLENPITNVFIWYHKRVLGHYRYSSPPFNYFMHSIFKILRPGSSPYRHQTFFGSFVLWPKLEWIQAPFSSIFDGNILLKIYCFRLTNQQINKSFPWDGIVSRSGCALWLILYYVYIFYFVHSLRCWFFLLFCFVFWYICIQRDIKLAAEWNISSDAYGFPIWTTTVWEPGD